MALVGEVRRVIGPLSSAIRGHVKDDQGDWVGGCLVGGCWVGGYWVGGWVRGGWVLRGWVLTLYRYRYVSMC